MKTNIYRPVLIRVLLFILISLYFITVFGQPTTAESKNSLFPSKSHSESLSINYTSDFSNLILSAIPVVIISEAGEHAVWITFYNNTYKKLKAKNPGNSFSGRYCYLPFDQDPE